MQQDFLNHLMRYPHFEEVFNTNLLGGRMIYTIDQDILQKFLEDPEFVEYLENYLDKHLLTYQNQPVTIETIQEHLPKIWRSVAKFNARQLDDGPLEQQLQKILPELYPKTSPLHQVDRSLLLVVGLLVLLVLLVFFRWR